MFYVLALYFTSLQLSLVCCIYIWFYTFLCFNLSNSLTAFTIYLPLPVRSLSFIYFLTACYSLFLVASTRPFPFPVKPKSGDEVLLFACLGNSLSFNSDWKPCWAEYLGCRFFHHFKYIMPLLSGLQSFCWKISQ